MARAAGRPNIDRTTLYYKLKRYGMSTLPMGEIMGALCPHKDGDSDPLLNQVPGPTSDVCILTAPSNQGSCATVGCVYAIGVPSISIHSLQVDGDVGLFFGSGTVSIATSLTVQASPTAPNASSIDLYYGTNLNCSIVDVQYGGALLGYGTIEGSLTNNGYIRVDDALTVTGTYTQTTGGELYEFWGRGSTGAVLNVWSARHHMLW